MQFAFFLFAGIVNSNKKTASIFGGRLLLKIDTATHVRAAGFFAA
jgi:hypothetical protein